MSDVLWAPSKPAHWDGASLRWLADIFAGGTPDKDNLDYWTNGTIPWLNSGSVNDWSINEPSAHITRDAYAKSSAKWIPSHSIVLALAGQGKTKGTAARLEIDSTCNQSMAAIVPSASLEYRFLHFWLASNYQNIRNLAGGDKRDGLNLVHVGGVQVPLPPVGEQRAIADYLDREVQKIDELITEQRGLIETLRERRYACIERAVTCGISDAQLGESSIPWIARMPLDWGVSRMKHETAMTTGGTPDTDDLAYWSEASDEAGVPWVAISDMSRRRSVCSTSKRLTPAGVASKRLRIGKAGTILFAMYASVGEVSRLDVDATWNQAILGITPGDRLESGYLAYLLMAMRTFMLGEVRTNTQANLNARQVGDMPLPIPLLEEQREIVDYLDEQTARIDELISESEDLIALSQERRAALITAAVTGQIDVREVA